MKEDIFERYTVTAALPYANGPIHIGHLAGVYVPADIYVRYLRSRKRDVIFICGSDEHGVAITIRARNEGKTPEQVIDQYHFHIKDSFARFGISFDNYARTSSPVHHETAAGMFKKMYDAGVFEEQESEQYFDEVAGQFLADRYIKGTCPNCGYEEAYGDQCEKCGTSLSPSELGSPRSMLSGSKPVMKKTKHWYLPLNQYEEWLRQWILQEHTEWKPNVYGQCKSWIDNGLLPRAMTRDLDWGIKVPLPDAEGKVLYVWFDAPIGYISSTREWARENGKDWELYWKDEKTRLIHFIGKDNIVFHCITFPTVLKAHGEFILPDNVPANEFLNLEGNKLSTSRNWAVWLHEYLDEFPGKEDVLRYALCSNMPETKDNDFTWKDFQARNNNELVAIYGNFVNRAIVLTHKYFDGKVPAFGGEPSEADKTLIKALTESPEKIANSIENFRFREALIHFMDLARAGNKYLADTEPWKRIKDDVGGTGNILNLALQLVANLAIVSEPFLPKTAEKLRAVLSMEQPDWQNAGDYKILPENLQIGSPGLLFEKIDDAAIEKQVEKLLATRASNELAEAQVVPEKEVITYDDFIKMDLRTATILEAESVKGSSKLLKLRVDTGIDQRTVVSGIAKYYKPEEVVGREVTVLANLAPRKIMGIESKGMILMAEDHDGKLVFIRPDKAVRNGSIIS
ncbi:MAG: methionine--tRNA ligase [Cyclobacteriaceae bacterium]|nr:methionine--tRNA ligase [Cyclobacteriaceae bacterium]